MNDGTVTATGSVMGGAGIGGGDYGDGSNITINGGTITVLASPDAKNSFSAGIGGGENGNGNNITINNGTITVTSSGGACIGGGEYGDGDEIIITGGCFLLYFSGMVQSSIPRAYIGRGSSGTTGTVTITGGFFGAGAGADGELSITKTVDKSVARSGDMLTYEITVSGASADRNTVYGVEPADSYIVAYTTDAEISGTYPYMVVKGVAGGFSDIYVVDELPSGLTFVSASDDGDYSDVDNKVTWVIDALSSGDSKTLTLVTTVD
ncbi:MAG: DUF11 domain-containing protein [Clostridiales bacterium]|nr:DUF11 domain-containing protein [Clostridiales bacterium]